MFVTMKNMYSCHAMMRRMSPQSVLFLVFLLCSRHGCDASLSEPGEPKIRCVEVERKALLYIKHDLHGMGNYPSDDVLSSWGNEDEKRDCCKWLGIRCANGSGHVVMLDLSPSTLGIPDFYSLPVLGGTIPTWIGKSLSKLTILSLRSNHFYGSMPYSLCHLSSLQVLDLSLNAITGSIPKCISNFSALTRRGGHIAFQSLTRRHEVTDDSAFGYEEYIEKMQLNWKGQPREFKNTLALVKSIELSSNKFNGEIPREITELSELVSLNLSRNNLSGQIPAEIGRMKSLDVLDLSWNHLIGQIPSSLAQIDRLNTFDLSYNNLSGKIPTSTQLQSFPNAYKGNLELCGDPLPKNCLDTKQTVSGAANEESDKIFNRGFYISMAIGFIIAFWGVGVALIFNKSFRYAYFKLLNDIGDHVCVTASIKKAKLLRMIKG